MEGTRSGRGDGQAQYSQIANRLDDLAAELLAGACSDSVSGSGPLAARSHTGHLRRPEYLKMTASILVRLGAVGWLVVGRRLLPGVTKRYQTPTPQTVKPYRSPENTLVCRRER
jgi:hypothetical protein